MATLEDPPYPTFLVDLARRMTLPWRGWLTRLLAALEDVRVRTERVETIVDSAVLLTALHTVAADLGPTLRRSGALELELPIAPVGAVVVQQGPGRRPDEAQAVQVLALGELLGGRRIRVHWVAVGGPARGPVVFHVLTGGPS